MIKYSTYLTCKIRLRAEVLSSSEEQEELLKEEDEVIESEEFEEEEEIVVGVKFKEPNWVERLFEKKSSTSSKFGIGIVKGSGEFIKSEPAKK